MSKASSLIPLFLTLFVVIILAAVGFVAWAIVSSISDTTSKKMEKHNISMSRQGMRVGVKDIDNEKYADKTQSVLMNVWNSASWPGYNSRLGWGQTKDKKAGSSSSSGKSKSTSTSTGAEPRRTISRHSSSQQNVAKG